MRHFFRALATILFLIGPSNTLAAESKHDFLSECPVLLSHLDNFANECLAGAREEDDTFNGESEVHGAFMGGADPGSHFALGCTLNWKHQIDYVGVYYSTNNRNFAFANTAPIAYVDLNGNIGIIHNRKLINFVMVRQFGDISFPPHFESGVVKNCEKSFSSEGIVAGAYGGSFSVAERITDTNIFIKGCIGGSCLHEAEYTKFFSVSNESPIYNGQFFTFLICGDGALLIRNTDISRYCPVYRESAARGTLPNPKGIDILREICLQ